MGIIGKLVRNLKEAPLLFQAYRIYTELKTARNYKRKNLHEIFNEIKYENKWGGLESVSGLGSDLVQTKVIIEKIPKILQKLGIKEILDLPCGDHHWMKEVNLEGISYIGGDIVKSLINDNNKLYSKPNKKFGLIDLTRDDLPEVDLILVRDCLVHLSFQNINDAIINIKRSKIKYLLTTTFPFTVRNYDITNGNWRPLNLMRPTFNFPSPLEEILEHCTESYGQYSDKSLFLWDTNNLPNGFLNNN